MGIDLCDGAQISELLARHGFRFSKSMGQNFLIEGWVPREIAASSGAGPGVGVLEIGPGIGPLTVQLAERSERVAAVELDEALLPILEETLAECDNVTVIPGDVMKLDLAALAEEQFGLLRRMVCANLPYNITTPVLTKLLESRLFEQVTVMVQKEAAERICAAPGSKNYGVFAVLCQYYTRPEILFEVPRTCFLPAPKVTSAVVRMEARPRPDFVRDEGKFFTVVRAAFGQRRKTLLNALSSVFSLEKEVLGACITQAGLPADIRGERLTILEFAKVSEAISARLGEGGR